MILLSQEDGPLELASLMLSPHSTADESSRRLTDMEPGFANKDSTDEHNVLLMPLRPTHTPSTSDE